MKSRKAAYAGLLVIGLGMVSLAISVNVAFLGAAVVFLILGSAGLAKEKRREEDGDDPPTT